MAGAIVYRLAPPGTPHDHEPDVIYSRAAKGVGEVLVFLCPCGCGHSILLPLGRWTLDRSSVTITPSVRVVGGCAAHFNITNGQVQMHSDSGAASEKGGANG